MRLTLIFLLYTACLLTHPVKAESNASYVPCSDTEARPGDVCANCIASSSKHPVRETPATEILDSYVEGQQILFRLLPRSIIWKFNPDTVLEARHIRVTIFQWDGGNSSLGVPLPGCCDIPLQTQNCSYVSEPIVSPPANLNNPSLPPLQNDANLPPGAPPLPQFPPNEPGPFFLSPSPTQAPPLPPFLTPPFLTPPFLTPPFPFLPFLNPPVADGVPNNKYYSLSLYRSHVVKKMPERDSTPMFAIPDISNEPPVSSNTMETEGRFHVFGAGTPTEDSTVFKWINYTRHQQAEKYSYVCTFEMEKDAVLLNGSKETSFDVDSFLFDRGVYKMPGFTYTNDQVINTYESRAIECESKSFNGTAIYNITSKNPDNSTFTCLLLWLTITVNDSVEVKCMPHNATYSNVIVYPTVPKKSLPTTLIIVVTISAFAAIVLLLLLIVLVCRWKKNFHKMMKTNKEIPKSLDVVMNEDIKITKSLNEIEAVSVFSIKDYHMPEIDSASVPKIGEESPAQSKNRNKYNLQLYDTLRRQSETAGPEGETISGTNVFVMSYQLNKERDVTSSGVSCVESGCSVGFDQNDGTTGQYRNVFEKDTYHQPPMSPDSGLSSASENNNSGYPTLETEKGSEDIDCFERKEAKLCTDIPQLPAPCGIYSKSNELGRYHERRHSLMSESNSTISEASSYGEISFESPKIIRKPQETLEMHPNKESVVYTVMQGQTLSDTSKKDILKNTEQFDAYEDMKSRPQKNELLQLQISDLPVNFTRLKTSPENSSTEQNVYDPALEYDIQQPIECVSNYLDKQTLNPL